MIRFGKYRFDENTTVVTDENLSRLYGLKGENVFILPCGEQAKSFANAQKLCSFLLSRNLGKSDVVYAVGGGSVGDTAGFCCSVYKRGINMVNVPTTLLAMVDSGIGGKTALDLDGVKNAVGTFIKCDTLIDADFLSTLSPEQYVSGLGEIEKYKFLCREIDQYKGDIFGLIRLCAEYKNNLTEKDFYDMGARKRLNLGHTIGHALELQYDLPHGKAVLCGLHVELQLAKKLGVVSKSWYDNRTAALPKVDIPQITAETVKLVAFDKKNLQQDSVTFVLPTSKYRTRCVSVEKSRLPQLLGV